MRFRSRPTWRAILRTAGGGGGGGIVDQGTPAAVGSAWPVKVTDGVDVVAVTAAGAAVVDGSAVTQPVSAAALPLPAGASQEHTTAVSPSSVRLSDGAAFYKGTTPADTQPVSAAALPLPAGAATEATLATRLADVTFTGRINTQGQKTMAASTPVVIASDQSAVSVDARRGKTILFASVDVAAAGDNTIVAAVPIR